MRPTTTQAVWLALSFLPRRPPRTPAVFFGRGELLNVGPGRWYASPVNRYFKRLHDGCEPPGLERAILRRLPKVLLIGTMIPLCLSLLVRVLPAADDLEPSKAVLNVDIFAFATTLTFWIAILTIAIGCVVVVIMKGPAYVADAYPVAHASKPRSNEDDTRTHRPNDAAP